MTKEGGFRSAPGEISPEQRKKIAETRLRRQAERALRPQRSWEEEAGRYGGDVPGGGGDASDPEGRGARRGYPAESQEPLLDFYGDPVSPDHQLGAVQSMGHVFRPMPPPAPPTMRSAPSSATESSGMRWRSPSVESRAAGSWPRPDGVRTGGLLPNPFSGGDDVATTEALAWRSRSHAEILSDIERRRWDAYLGVDVEGDRPTKLSPQPIPEAPDTEKDMRAEDAVFDILWDEPEFRGDEDPESFRKAG